MGRHRPDRARARRHARGRLIEEVARIVLDRVPHTMPLRRSVAGHLSREQRLRRLVEDVLVGAGFSEAYTWSLVASDPDPAAIRLPDPMSGDQAILRTTLLDGPRRGSPGERRRRQRGDRPLRARARLPAERRAPARGALAGRRHRRRRLRGGAWRPRDSLRDAASRVPPERAQCCRSSTRARRRRPPPAGSGSSIRRCSRGHGACSSSISTS